MTVIARRYIIIEVVLKANDADTIDAATEDLVQRFLSKIPKHRMGQRGHARCVEIIRRLAWTQASFTLGGKHG